ncbi:leucine-rich repeat domain-containing protein [Desulfosporosinus sp. SYSU MS00001]|uniref:leucine-rich repeat domain-containing protein n=1 Tax=Desulfosporosinus sp. SYSU MS00001 TaxID=3416284 RepID=UPI003CF291B6
MKIKKVLTLLITSAMLLQSTLAFAGTIPRSQDSHNVIIETSVSLNKTSDVLKVGETEILVPKIQAPSDFAMWSSSDNSIATVNMKGKVTGVSPGTATITITSFQFKTATCKIRVIADNNSDLVKFKDKNLEKIVRYIIHKPKGDLYKSDVRNITHLEPPKDPLNGSFPLADSRDSIESIIVTQLNGIEYLTNLSYLSLKGNAIRDLGPLKELKNLKYLCLDNNHINDISELHGLTNLKIISLYNNEIDDISPLEGLYNLKTLVLSKNEIKKINYYQLSNICAFEGVPHMKSMYLDHNLFEDAAIRTIKAVNAKYPFITIDLGEK